MKEVEKLEAFLRSLVTPILGYPQLLEITKTVKTEAVGISISVGRSDTGRLIGERGNVFRGLRALTTAYGKNLGLRIHMLPIQEPVGGPDKGERTQHKPWDTQRLTREIEVVARKVFRYPDLLTISSQAHGPNGSLIELRVSNQEQGNIVDELSNALRDVFTAITKTNGHMVAVDVVTMTEEEMNTNKKGTEYAKTQSKPSGP